MLIINTLYLIMAGTPLLNAFDPLAVLNCSTRACIAVRDIGTLMMVIPTRSEISIKR